MPMYDAPNAVEELAQSRKHPTVEKVEACLLYTSPSPRDTR